jgi:hypothetical protein
MLDNRPYQLVLHDATTGKEIRRATARDPHRLNVRDDIRGYRIIRARPESTREVGHVDVVQHRGRLGSGTKGACNGRRPLIVASS